MKRNRLHHTVLIVVCIVTGFFGLFLSAEPNQLCKIFHHGSFEDQLMHNSDVILEIGKVVFYFSKEPEVRLLANRKLNGQNQEMTFFFPLTVVQQGECTKMLQSLCTVAHSLYSIAVEQVNKPVVGLRFSIKYNPQKIEITYDSFDSIGLYRGLVFTLYNKKLLEKIKDQGEPLIRTVSNDKKPSVIIDCGHGGSDNGTIGYGDVKEKDITLQIGLKVAGLLERRGIKVSLTRTSDLFVPLDQRTKLTGHPGRSVFISIHANSSHNEMASGIETFCLSPPLLHRCFKTMDDYTTRLLSYISCDYYRKSNKLANCLHQHVIALANQKNPHLNDRYVKHAVSQVLLGSVVPSALVEFGFLSNKHEAVLLQDPEYQSTLAAGICLGVLDYFSIQAFPNAS